MEAIGSCRYLAEAFARLCGICHQKGSVRELDVNVTTYGDATDRVLELLPVHLDGDAVGDELAAVRHADDAGYAVTIDATLCV